MKYNKDKYTEDIKNKLKNCVLTEYDNEIIKKLKENTKSKDINNVVSDIYILFEKYKYSPKEIGELYSRSARTIEIFLKNNNLQRDRFEAQKIASKKRNYKEIMNKGRNTIFNNSCFGSNPEQHLRMELNTKLPIYFQNFEIIIGMNNKSILDDGKEVDIPIIILNGNKIIKIAIEFDGAYWHNKNKDEKKDVLLKNKDYKIFRFKQNNKTNKNDIDNFIYDIIKYIKNNI